MYDEALSNALLFFCTKKTVIVVIISAIQVVVLLMQTVIFATKQFGIYKKDENSQKICRLDSLLLDLCSVGFYLLFYRCSLARISYFLVRRITVQYGGCVVTLPLFYPWRTGFSAFSGPAFGNKRHCPSFY